MRASHVNRHSISAAGSKCSRERCASGRCAMDGVQTETAQQSPWSSFTASLWGNNQWCYTTNGESSPQNSQKFSGVHFLHQSLVQRLPAGQIPAGSNVKACRGRIQGRCTTDKQQISYIFLYIFQKCMAKRSYLIIFHVFISCISLSYNGPPRWPDCLRSCCMKLSFVYFYGGTWPLLSEFLRFLCPCSIRKQYLHSASHLCIEICSFKHTDAVIHCVFWWNLLIWKHVCWHAYNICSPRELAPAWQPRWTRRGSVWLEEIPEDAEARLFEVWSFKHQRQVDVRWCK